VAVLSAYPGLILKEALATANEGLNADVVVWDAGGRAIPPALSPVLALVEAASDARQALRSGVRGALSRSAAAHTIPPAALAVAAGHWVVDESFGPALFGAEAAPPQMVPGLSRREQEVLALLTEGLTNRGVAERLGISRHTAKFHVNAILDKLGACSRTEAVVLAARGGLLTL
jgi:two-component system, NarL family, nitrate/nitrite response regulator NarL